MSRYIVLVTSLILLLSAVAVNAAVMVVSEYDILYTDSSNDTTYNDSGSGEIGMLMCTPGQPYFPDSCNVCGCNEDGTVGVCTLVFCSVENTTMIEGTTMMMDQENSTMVYN